MELNVLDGFHRIHSSPFTKTFIEDGTLTIEIEDDKGKIIRFIMSPYQAVRITTADCFVLPPHVMVNPTLIYEVQNSPWISELKRNLKIVDVTGAFLERSHHYLFPLHEDIIEVIAWEIQQEA